MPEPTDSPVQKPQQAARLSGLLARACAGSDPRAREAAFDELLRLLTIYVRAGMGSRLRDHRESMDVCQSLARSFVDDFEGGRIAFESEAALAAYVRQCVRSKLADLSRHDRAAKRGGGAVTQGLPGDGPHGGPGPASAAIAREAVAGALAALNEDERTLLRLRSQGLAWEAIARELGRTPEAVRQQFSRVQRRLAQGSQESPPPTR
ncbi:MAG TPA: sigma-70 family RNA polymerase sigma factor [Phycisphaerales bacterium]|nr:sigma-70 family RNA polymerase sigma factor [Phycisphaerales bacterium]